MYEARYWGILSAYTILHVQAGFIHVICLGISNKSVAVPRQDSIQGSRCPFWALQHNIFTRPGNINLVAIMRNRRKVVFVLSWQVITSVTSFLPAPSAEAAISRCETGTQPQARHRHDYPSGIILYYYY